MKKLFLVPIFFIVGCAPPTIDINYQLSTNTDPFNSININERTFDVKLSQEAENEIVEKKISLLISNALVKKGWVRDVSNPKYIFSAVYGISDGENISGTSSRPVTSSTYDYQTGKYKDHVTQKVSSYNYTLFEREINIYAHSSKKLVWSGELKSRGSTQDVMFVARNLIPEIIENIDQPDKIEEDTFLRRKTTDEMTKREQNYKYFNQAFIGLAAYGLISEINRVGLKRALSP